MSPRDIEVLIHCHVSASRHPRADEPAVRDAILRFEDQGLIIQKQPMVDVAPYWVTTPLGAAHIKQLCNLGLPVERKFFVSFDGKVIES